MRLPHQRFKRNHETRKLRKLQEIAALISTFDELVDLLETQPKQLRQPMFEALKPYLTLEPQKALED